MLMDEAWTDQKKWYTFMRQETFGFDEHAVFLGKKDVSLSMRVSRHEREPFDFKARTWLLLDGGATALDKLAINILLLEGNEQMRIQRQGTVMFLFGVAKTRDRD